MRVRQDVSFTGDTVDVSNANRCVFLDAQPRWCLSAKAFSNAASERTKGFTIKAGREVRIPIPQFERYDGGVRYEGRMRISDAAGTLEFFRTGDIRNNEGILKDARSARAFQEALEALTGMELITKIEDRCDPPIEVQKAPSKNRSQDGIQQQLHDQNPSSNEIKGNSAESGA